MFHQAVQGMEIELLLEVLMMISVVTRGKKLNNSRQMIKMMKMVKSQTLTQSKK